MGIFNPVAHQSSMQELDLLNPQLDPRISFSRASTKTYFGSNGLMQTAANDAWPLEYDPITLKPIGRSVWEQRTNLLLYSDQFDNAAWAKSQATITANNAVGPDGSMSMDKLVEDASAGSTHSASEVVALTAVPHTMSVYAKAGERSWMRLLFETRGAYFDLQNGVVGSISAGASATITPIGGGIYRCTLTHTPAAGSFSAFVRLANSDGGQIYSGDGTSGLYLCSAQLEAGAFASPYIPTAGSQVTRVADEVTFILAGIRFNALGMTLTAQAVSGAAMPADQAAVQIDNGSSANRWILYRKTTGAFLAVAARSTAGSAGDLNLFPAAPEGVAYRAVASFGDSNLRAVRDGGSVVQDTTTALPVGMTTGRVGKAAGASNYHNAPIQRLRFFPGQLADSELQSLTA